VPGFGLPLHWPEMQERAFQPLLPWYNDTLLFSALDATESPFVSLISQMLKSTDPSKVFLLYDSRAYNVGLDQ